MRIKSLTFIQQQGVVSVLLVAVISILSFLWVSTQHQNLISQYRHEQLDARILALKDVKQNLLTFAVLQPEIYTTNSDSELQSAENLPAIGYFPCPDVNGDGELLYNETMCGRRYEQTASEPTQTGFAPDPEFVPDAALVATPNCNGSTSCMGFVPSQFKSRFFYFAPAGRFYYVLDERFAFQNPNYNVSSSQYFAPLNTQEIKRQLTEDSVPLGLSLDDVDGYVALVIDAGNDDLSTENADGDRFFENIRGGQNLTEGGDVIIGISFNEWQTLMARRLCLESSMWRNGVSGGAPLFNSQPHWANAYHNTDNTYGSGWSEVFGQCQF